MTGAHSDEWLLQRKSFSLKSKLLGFTVSTIRWMHLRAYVVGGIKTRAAPGSLNISSFKASSKKVVVCLAMMAPKFFLAMMRAPFWLSVSASAAPPSTCDHPFWAKFSTCFRVSGSPMRSSKPALSRTLKGSKSLLTQLELLTELVDRLVAQKNVSTKGLIELLPADNTKSFAICRFDMRLQAHSSDPYIPW